MCLSPFATRMVPAMFQIKICGIMDRTDAEVVAQAGGDAVGLNFYSGSPRCITPQTAREIVAALPAGVAKVGVFVDESVGDVCRLFDELPLDLVQLHGRQPPEFLVQLGRRPVLRAFRVGVDGLAPVADYLRRCRELGVMPHGVLLDSLVPGRRGDWSAAARYAATPEMPPLVLAGGLTPENVADAIRAVRPAAVDVAGGVESAPGRKDRTAVELFIRAARAAFEAVARNVHREPD
jgi:phosphoribosylanthranilate isomerase